MYKIRIKVIAVNYSEVRIVCPNCCNTHIFNYFPKEETPGKVAPIICNKCFYKLPLIDDILFKPNIIYEKVMCHRGIPS